MRVIYKYPIVITGDQSLKMGDRAEIISAVKVGDQVCIYARVDPTGSLHYVYHIAVVGTGQQDWPRKEGYKFLNTVVDREFVWHIYYKFLHKQDVINK